MYQLLWKKKNWTHSFQNRKLLDRKFRYTIFFLFWHRFLCRGYKLQIINVLSNTDISCFMWECLKKSSQRMKTHKSNVARPNFLFFLHISPPHTPNTLLLLPRLFISWQAVNIKKSTINWSLSCLIPNREQAKILWNLFSPLFSKYSMIDCSPPT
jgi:hypothetical protein